MVDVSVYAKVDMLYLFCVQWRDLIDILHWTEACEPQRSLLLDVNH